MLCEALLAVEHAIILAAKYGVLSTLSLNDDSNQLIYFAKSLNVLRKAITDFDIERLISTAERLGFTGVTTTNPMSVYFLANEISICGKFAIDCIAERTVRSAFNFLISLPDICGGSTVEQYKVSGVSLRKEPSLRALSVFRVAPLVMSTPTPIYYYFAKA